MFKGSGYSFKVHKDGSISIIEDNPDDYILDSLPALYDAVELSKQIRNKDQDSNCECASEPKTAEGTIY